MEECELAFNLICVSGTLNTELQNNSNLSLAGFDSSRFCKRGGGFLIFIKSNLSYKIRKDLSESDEHKEKLSLEISYKNSSIILLIYCYKPPKGANDILSIFLKQVFKKPAAEKKCCYLIRDLNTNCLEYFANIVNKLTRVAKRNNKIRSLKPFTDFLFN